MLVLRVLLGLWLGWASTLSAHDSTFGLQSGTFRFENSPHVSLQKEVLTIGIPEITVDYVFRNESAQPLVVPMVSRDVEQWPARQDNESASGATVSKESPIPYSQEQLNHLLRRLSGAWVNEGYLSKVKSTHSLPKTSNYPMPVLKIGDHVDYADYQSEIIGPAPSFHEGGAYAMDVRGAYKFGKFIRVSLVLSSAHNDVALHLPEGDPALEAFIEFKEENPNRFVYVHGKTQRTFKRLDNPEELQSVEMEVNRLVVAGKYEDQSGNIYSFSEDMVAVFPDKTFKYSIPLDSYLYRPGVDIQLQASVARYAMRFMNEKIYLYETVDLPRSDMEGYTLKKPALAVLTKLLN